MKRLRDLVNGDAFFGVRQEAVSALKSIHNRAALEALLTSTKQSDAQVRIRVMDAIGAFYEDKAFAATVAALDSEKNPDILIESIQALAAQPNKDVTARLIKFLEAKSFHERVANTAISTLRSRRDPAAVAPIMDILDRKSTRLNSSHVSESRMPSSA